MLSSIYFLSGMACEHFLLKRIPIIYQNKLKAQNKNKDSKQINLFNPVRLQFNRFLNILFTLKIPTYIYFIFKCYYWS